MNKCYKSFCIFAAMTLFITACSVQTVQAQPEDQIAPQTVTYKDILGKPLNDQAVTEFLTINHCSGAAQFELCEEIGVALLIASDQVVKTVYLYLNNADGFVPYKGELPFGLKFYDTMGAVEYKLKRQRVGAAGLPDRVETPDHLHCWATYQQAGMTIIYNSPSAEDEDATIHAILVSR
jgi:hypothetical protein